MTEEIKYMAKPKATFNIENNYAIINFDSNLYEASPAGSHPIIIVPNATNKEVAMLLGQDVDTWNSYYVTKAVKILEDKGYNPVVLHESIIIGAGDDDSIFIMSADEDKLGNDEISEENEEDGDEE